MMLFRRRLRRLQNQVIFCEFVLHFICKCNKFHCEGDLPELSQEKSKEGLGEVSIDLINLRSHRML